MTEMKRSADYMREKKETQEDNSLGFFILLALSLCLFVIYSLFTGHMAIFLTLPIFACALYGIEEFTIIGLRVSLTNTIDRSVIVPYNTPEAKRIYQTKMDPRVMA